MKALLIWIRLLAYLLAHLVALKAAGTGQEANFGLWMSGGRYVCQMNWLDCTFSGATFLKVSGNPPPRQRIGIQDACSEAPHAWGPLPPHDPAPLLGEAFFNFHVSCLHQISSTVSQYLVLFSSAPCTTLNHLVYLPTYLSTDLLPWT